MRGSRGWQGFKLLVIGLGGLVAVSACTSAKNDLYPETARVKIPWYTSSGYKMQIVELVSVTNMQRLQGWAAKFLLAPGILNGKLIGLEPDIRTIRTSDGAYVPTDYLSAELLSMYAHFEKLQQLDMKVGAEQLIKNWPRPQTIGVRAVLAEGDEWVKKDNALFSGDLGAFLFVPYQRGELPLSVNAGVIGHEYFHAIFNEIFNRQLETNHDNNFLKNAMGLVQQAGADSNMDLYHQTLLRGINEGLADVWGWIYSDDENFVERSNSNPLLHFRKLNLPPVFYTKENVLVFSNHFKENTSVAYEIGTMYSRRLFQAVKKSHLADKAEAKRLLAKGILRMLVQLQAEFKQKKSEDLLEPTRPLELLQNEIPQMKIWDGEQP
jgi:hypothetical protein